MTARLTCSQRNVADIIYNRGAVKFGAFKLKFHEKDPTAPPSPIYITLRKPPDGPLTDQDVEAIGKELNSLAKKKKILFDVIAGIPRAGEPFAEVIARLSGRPLIKLGKKTVGDKRKIDSVIGGEYKQGQLVLLIDDLITKSDTKKEAIAMCENAGLTVSAVVVLIDREQGGSEELRVSGHDLYAVFTLSAILDYYVQTGEIDSVKRNEVINYIAINR